MNLRHKKPINSYKGQTNNDKSEFNDDDFKQQGSSNKKNNISSTDQIYKYAKILSKFVKVINQDYRHFQHSNNDPRPLDPHQKKIEKLMIDQENQRSFSFGKTEQNKQIKQLAKLQQRIQIKSNHKIHKLPNKKRDEVDEMHQDKSQSTLPKIAQNSLTPNKQIKKTNDSKDNNLPPQSLNKEKKDLKINSNKPLTNNTQQKNGNHPPPKIQPNHNPSHHINLTDAGMINYLNFPAILPPNFLQSILNVNPIDMNQLLNQYSPQGNMLREQALGINFGVIGLNGLNINLNHFEKPINLFSEQVKNYNTNLINTSKNQLDKAYVKKVYPLKRNAYHVTIAYKIYLDKLKKDGINIQNLEEIDPTRNARRIKSNQSSKANSKESIKKKNDIGQFFIQSSEYFTIIQQALNCKFLLEMSKKSSKTNLCERLKYKLIELPLQKQLSEYMSNSLKSIDHKSSLSNLKKKCIFQTKSIKYIQNNLATLTELHNTENTKKVAFKPNLIEILQSDFKDQSHYHPKKLNAYERKDSLKVSLFTKKASFLQNSKNTSKHLTSLTCIKSTNNSVTKKLIPTSRSKRSMKSFEEELLLQKKQIQQYLFKIQIFFESKFTQKQLIEWLIQYCKRQNIILLNFFLRSTFSKRKGKKVQKEWEVQRNYDVLISKLEQKHPDRHLCIKRFVKLIELKALNNFLEMLYADKNRVKMKEFQDQIGDNIRKLCDKIRISQNNEFVVKNKTRNVEVVKFLEDVQSFEEQFGNLKCISGMNRLRFKMINDTDNLIEKQICEVNGDIKNIQKENIPTIIS